MIWEVYLLFSYLFVYGQYKANRGEDFTWWMVLLAPVTFPFGLGAAMVIYLESLDDIRKDT